MQHIRTRFPKNAVVNQGHRLSKDLMFFFPLQETGGQLAGDVTLRNAPGVLTNGAVFNRIQNGDSCLFDGSNDYIDCGNRSNYNFGGRFTFVVWFRMVSNSVQSHWFIGKDLDTGRSFDFGIFRNASLVYHLTAQINGNNIPNTAQFGANTAITIDNQWHQAIFTCDGTNGVYYLDGVNDGSFTENVAAPNVTTTKMYIGRRDYPSNLNYWNGYLKNIMGYNRYIEPSEARELFVDPYCMLKERTNYRRYIQQTTTRRRIFITMSN